MSSNGSIAPRALTFRARDGYALSGILVAPPDPRAAMLVSPGTGFPKEFYLKFAQYAASRGYAVLAYDYRGMGGSAPESLRGFPAKMSDWGRLDMPAALDAVAEAAPGTPITIVGHSAGAQLVGLMDNAARVDRIAAIAASTGWWRWQPMPFRLAAWTLWFAYGPFCLATLGYIPGGKVWQGLALPPGVFREWRRWCRDVRYFGVDFGTTLRGHHYDEVRAELRDFCFTDDPIGNTRAVPALLAYYRNTRPTIEWIAPSDVGAPAIGHHGFFYARFRETLWKRVVDWLDMPGGAAHAGGRFVTPATPPQPSPTA
jgi:predicted alpha/beta hydrolase